MKYLYLLFPIIAGIALACAIGAEPAPTPSGITIEGDIGTIEVERQIVVKDKFALAKSLPFKVKAPAGAFDYRWKYPQGITVVDDDSETLEVTAAPKGLLTVSVRILTFDAANKPSKQTLTITLVVGEAKPPEPPPSPAPIPVDGFRVLFVIETAANIPADQRTVLASATIREYLNKKCADGPRNKEWRQWDQHTDVSSEAKHWQDIFAKKPAKDKLPWLVISTGKDGYEGPMPKTVADTLALLKKFGGE